MLDNPEFISNFIEDQFPEIFRESNSEIVQFVLAYYEWLETSGQTTKVLRNLKNNRDIDDSVSDFIIHFKKTFLQGTQLSTESDERFMIKHISDLYQSKGSIRSIELLIRMLFGQEIEVFLPSSRVLIPSQSSFTKPVYLELSPSERTKTFIGKEVIGSSSNATAFVESVITKVISGKRLTLAFLSNVVGNFQTGEFISDDGQIDDAPKMVGSLTNISITNGGRLFSVGDTFNVISSTGKDGKAKVTGVQDATGKVDYELANGGYGYTVSNNFTRTLSSNATIVVENTVNANVDREDFFLFETVQQPLANVSWNAGMSNTAFVTAANSGSLLIGINIASNTAIANGFWVASGVGNTVTIQIANGDFTDADFIRVGAISNVASNVAISSVVNATASGEFIGRETRESANVIGLNANNKPFIKGTKAFVVGVTSNTYANIANTGTGIGGDFEVGALGTQETLSLFTDIIGANNTAANPQPTSTVHVNGSNSGIGFVDSVIVDTSIGINAKANSGMPFAANGTFAAGDYIFEANIVVNSIHVTTVGSGYSNSDTVTFTGGSPGTTAVANIVTDNSGGVQGVEISNNGIDYQSVPAVTINTSGGSSAVLKAKMRASGNSIGAVGNIKSVPNTNHIIVRNLANGAFTNGRTITNEGVNAFANVANSTLLAGTGYAPSDTVTFSGGAPNVTATGVFSANASNSGSVHSITVNEPGTEYDANASIVINTSTGSGASVSVNMDFGYGLPKSGSADLTTILYNALTFSTFTIGTIESLNFINPGSGYNLDPVPLAHNPYVAGFNRRDIICVIGNRNGLFIEGEALSQTLSLGGFSVAHSGNITLDGGTPIAVGEGVSQAATNATGVIETSNATHITISNPVGTFNDATDIITLSSNAAINPDSSGVAATTISAIATGTYKSLSTVNNVEQVKIRRLKFGQAFSSGASLTGATSGATADVLFAYQDDTTLPIGLNAVVNATVITANGVASNLEVINSGYGYEANAIVQLQNDDTPFIVTGTAQTGKQGVGEGQWRDRVSFIGDVSKIQDSDYYQEYSYVVRTGIALAKYQEQLKEILHVSGTKLFGEVVKIRESDTLAMQAANATITTS
tara:strand:+ start:3244 stop:6540 length:3297 start_codon:yes stop_codon:yes gene_type:complete